MMVAMPNEQNKRTTSQQLSLGDLTDYQAPLLKQLEEYMQRQVETFEPEVKTLVQECMHLSGKRLRPILVFATGWPALEEPIQAALVKCAAIVEWVHWATLVHDDILDNASVRRSHPTLHKTHGVNTAVLVGDALFAHALETAASFSTNKVCRCMARATRLLCSGEIAQTLRSSKGKMDEADYFRIIDLKTAQLFATSCEMGAYLGGYDPAFVKAAEVFGRQLGTAYQIYDDLIDFFGQEAAFGKTLGTDWTTDKWTLPRILLWQQMPEERLQLLQKQMADNEQASLELLRPLMQEYHILQLALKAFDQSLNLAQQALNPFSDLQVAQQLLKLLPLIQALPEQLS